MDDVMKEIIILITIRYTLHIFMYNGFWWKRFCAIGNDTNDHIHQCLACDASHRDQ